MRGRVGYTLPVHKYGVLSKSCLLEIYGMPRPSRWSVVINNCTYWCVVFITDAVRLLLLEKVPRFCSLPLKVKVVEGRWWGRTEGIPRWWGRTEGILRGCTKGRVTGVLYCIHPHSLTDNRATGLLSGLV